MIGTVTNRSASLVRRVVEFPGQKPKQRALDRLIGRPFSLQSRTAGFKATARHCNERPAADRKRDANCFRWRLTPRIVLGRFFELCQGVCAGLLLSHPGR